LRKIGQKLVTIENDTDKYFGQMDRHTDKFEEDRTKTSVAIDSDNYPFEQTHISTDFILCSMP